MRYLHNVPDQRDGCKLGAVLPSNGKFCCDVFSRKFDYASNDRRVSGSFSELAQTGRNLVPVSFRSPNPRGSAAARDSQTKYVIERIELMGNRRIESDRLRARISTRSGDPYSVEAVRGDVRALWNTQFFDDVRSEVEDSPHLPNGKIVVFIVVEKPIIGRIEYKGITSISESDILNALKDERVGLSVGSWFDRAKLKHAVVVISELLAANGHQFATVKPAYEKIPSTNTVTLVFNIDEGPKAQKSRNRS